MKISCCTPFILFPGTSLFTLPALPQERTETEKAKARLDQAQLALQSILYEKSYYLNETRAILNFPCAFQHHRGSPLALGVQNCIYLPLAMGCCQRQARLLCYAWEALLQTFASPLFGDAEATRVHVQIKVH